MYRVKKAWRCKFIYDGEAMNAEERMRKCGGRSAEWRGLISIINGMSVMPRACASVA